MSFNSFNIYPNSIQIHNDSLFFMANIDKYDMLVISGLEMGQFNGKEMSIQGKTYKLCPLTVENSKKIRKLFDFTNPVSHREKNVTIGLGDRLGIASAGHLRLLCNLDVFPVLAQQSMRELSLTGRTYEDVLSAAVWAVFREGYTKGYGADGDHLKTHDEVKNALECGFTMITLDCSEHIDNDLWSAAQSEIDMLYSKLPADDVMALENCYINKTFPIDENFSISFHNDDFKRMVLIYIPAIKHALNIYNDLIKETKTDFEVSIDETLSKTSPEQHFFVASELIKQGCDMVSLAPRFVGEFQKGIDYRGDVSEFEHDFRLHAKIAEKFGYKISVHSGSDKFSIFPIVGKLTGNKYHLKTSGTNWLEAVRVIAIHAPELYREIHRFALENLSQARKYYHVIADCSNITDINDVTDAELPYYLDRDDSRQVLHITYGLVLMAKNDDGSCLFRERIFEVLNTHEQEYFTALEKRIGQHLKALEPV